MALPITFANLNTPVPLQYLDQNFTYLYGLLTSSSGAPFLNATAAPYNADPTGVTDCHVGIQNALNTGIPVWLPAGNYNVGTVGLTLTGTQTLIGMGGKGFLSNLNYSGTGNGILLVGNYCHLEGVSVTGSGAGAIGVAVLNNWNVLCRDIGINLSSLTSIGLWIGSTSGTFWNAFEEFNINAGTPVWMTATGQSINQNVFTNFLCRSPVVTNGYMVYMNGSGANGVGNNKFENFDCSAAGGNTGMVLFNLQGNCGSNQFIDCYIDNSGSSTTGYWLSGTSVLNTQIIGGYIGSTIQIIDNSQCPFNLFAYTNSPFTFTGQITAQNFTRSQSANRGNTTPITLTVGTDAQVQFFATTFTTNQVVNLSNSFTSGGGMFRINRTGLGAYTLTVNNGVGSPLKVFPSATAAWGDFEYNSNGASWALTAYGTL